MSDSKIETVMQSLISRGYSDDVSAIAAALSDLRDINARIEAEVLPALLSHDDEQVLEALSDLHIEFQHLQSHCVSAIPQLIQMMNRVDSADA